MTLLQFIKEHRTELDKYIRKLVPNCQIDDSERRLWIMNDEDLYNWARAEGVHI